MRRRTPPDVKLRSALRYTEEEKAIIGRLKAQLVDPSLDANTVYKVTLTLRNMEEAAAKRVEVRQERQREWRERNANANAPAVTTPTRGKSRRSPDEDERVAAFLAFCASGEGADA